MGEACSPPLLDPLSDSSLYAFFGMIKLKGFLKGVETQAPTPF